MGLNEIKRWINILMLQELMNDRLKKLIKTSFIRTNFAESIAIPSELKIMKHEASIMGLFSTLAVMHNQPLEVALKGIVLPSSITEALIQGRGILFLIYQLITAYEQGEWVATENIAKQLNINKNNLFSEYIASIQWINEVLEMIV